MEAITQWFKGEQEYYTGVALYASLPEKKLSVVRRLNRGKNNHNMATLVSELRKLKNIPKITQKPEKPIFYKKITQEVINIKTQRQQQANESLKREFGGIKLGDLPAELRPEFLKAQSVFYQMIELKFALNDLPAEAEEDALKIQLQIEALDDTRDAIWAALHHWKTHKTLLDTPKNNFEDLDKFQLDKKRRNLRSQRRKQLQRIEKWYEALVIEKTASKVKLLENKINKGEKAVFAHELNIKKINSML